MRSQGSSKTIARRRREKARRVLAGIPWPSEAERAKERASRDAALTSEEKFRAQLALLRLVERNPKAMAAARRWHDLQDAIEQQRFRELFERYEKKRRRATAASRSASSRRRGA
jgi:predicted RNA-binding protein